SRGTPPIEERCTTCRARAHEERGRGGPRNAASRASVAPRRLRESRADDAPFAFARSRGARAEHGRRFGDAGSLFRGRRRESISFAFACSRFRNEAPCAFVT